MISERPSDTEDWMAAENNGYLKCFNDLFLGILFILVYHFYCNFDQLLAWQCLKKALEPVYFQIFRCDIKSLIQTLSRCLEFNLDWFQFCRPLFLSSCVNWKQLFSTVTRLQPWSFGRMRNWGWDLWVTWQTKGRHEMVHINQTLELWQTIFQSFRPCVLL